MPSPCCDLCTHLLAFVFQFAPVASAYVTLEEVCLALLHCYTARVGDGKLPAGLALVLQAIRNVIGQAQFCCYSAPVSTRDVLLGLFDALTISQH